METVQKAWNYIQENPEKFLEAFREHLILSIVALVIAMIVSITIGIICAKKENISSVLMGIFNSLRVIPSLAILIIVLPIMGTGFYPALIALTVLACPPIIINTFTGFREIDRSVIEAASGMGMNEKQILKKIEFPLALPIIIAGCRTAAVEVVASATLAAFIGGGGLGTFIINGLGMYNIPLLLVGAIPVALLAILSEVSFATTEKFFTRYLRD